MRYIYLVGVNLLEAIGKRYSIADENEAHFYSEMAVIKGMSKWHDLFGHEVFVVEWDRFLEALQVPLDKETEKNLKNILG